jgi:RHH-type proline utilization regulon transcriptional repressor/proline dehydrogenase/delta 1-pyrroline-5-carboxylate dehydrogenase
LLQEFPISSAEGLALMRLAEALLRVPDVDTAIALTADQLRRADFGGHGESALGRLSHSVVALSRHLLPEGSDVTGSTATLGARAVVAAAVRAVQLLGRQFVLGEDIGQALAEADRIHRDLPHLCFSFDMLGEGARTEADAQRHFRAYVQALERIAAKQRHAHTPMVADGLSIKLSALHPRYEELQRERVMTELVPRVWRLCQLAAQADLNLTLDAEESDRLELSLDVADAIMVRIAQECPSWKGFGLAIQAYQTRALEWVEHLVGLARQHRVELMCRLVKGAYWDTEIKRAQEAGLSHHTVFTHKHHTDISYLACAQALLSAPDAIFPQFATHNAGTIAAIQQMAESRGARFELQRLHGMGEALYREVLRREPMLRCRVYAPVGPHRDLLAYLVRRLLENGANTSFVNQLADPTHGIDTLLDSPLHVCPEPGVPLPAAIFGATRLNSAGVDLGVRSERERLLKAWRETGTPHVPLSRPEDLPHALARARRAFPMWRDTPVAQRAQVLRRAADELQGRLPAFSAMLVHEAHKTWGDAVAEVREAIDFLRHDADEAERVMAPLPLPAHHPGATGVTGESNVLTLRGRGAWVCISPWNFPLAIFVGQVAAALATGNTVLAKPAEQTPGVAAAAVRLLHDAGVPSHALQLLHGTGDSIGAGLVALPGIAGVAFTGSTEVAKLIQRALAASDGPIVPLLAETGGINAMVVDPSALPEQVCDAVLQSSFRSAGQRCSALRLLCLHDDIADDVIEMICGAARELKVGDPARFDTDVGPLIDEDAHRRVLAQVQALAGRARPLWPAPPADVFGPHTLAPLAFELDRLETGPSGLMQEIFGPVLLVWRWSGDPLHVIDRINQLGFGLTLGIQTRIDSRAQALARAAEVGNVYVNRNMVGAVVGLQPFGGQGLSGTGPKAGGPHHLVRFCVEQCVTINTTAAGGNVSLMTGLNRPA